MDFYYKEELLQLLPEKVAFLPKYKLLVVADLHLGKASHFRKAGINLPLPSESPDLRRLEDLIKRLQPSTVIFLGDLFHSALNKEWDSLKIFLTNFPAIRFVLTKGNHDILPPAVMQDSTLDVVDELEVGDYLLFSHEPLSESVGEKLNIYGHIHPGVLIKSPGRQSFRLPCYFYHEQQLILPAFGQLTGLHVLKKSEGVKIYAVFPDEVIAIP